MADLFVGIEVEPALSPLVLRPTVPGDSQNLQASVGKFDQILLQGINAESVSDRELGRFAVRPVGLDQEFAIAIEKARADAEILEGRAGEIPEHRSVARVRHGELVVRAGPPRR